MVRLRLIGWDGCERRRRVLPRGWRGFDESWRRRQGRLLVRLRLIRGNGRERCGRMLPQVGCGEANADTVASQGIEQSPFAIGKG